MPVVTTRPIRLGDKVRLRTLGKEGVVTALSKEEAEIQVGNLRVRVELYDLDLVGGKIEEKPKTEAGARGEYKAASPGVELPLRGMAADEALEALDRYLDQAYMAGLPYVRLVHGKGTGKLRDAVRRALKSHPLVKRFEAGGPSEGGDGVTVAFLQN
jgi:DNA mismatch repair protein MutS2